MNSFVIWYRRETGEIFLGQSDSVKDRYMASDGWERKGRIETDLGKLQLEQGIGGPVAQERDRLREKLRQVQAVVNRM